MTNTKTLTKADLAQFTGSENWYRHALARDILYTDGAKYMAQHGGAYWLLDEIALPQRFDKLMAAHKFQLWKLKDQTTPPRSFARTATATASTPRPSNSRISHSPEIKLYFCNKTILLPSEWCKILADGVKSRVNRIPLRPRGDKIWHDSHFWIRSFAAPVVAGSSRRLCRRRQSRPLHRRLCRRA